MVFGKITLIGSSALKALYGLLMLVNSIVFIRSGAGPASGWLKWLAVGLPAVLLLCGAVSLVLNAKLYDRHKTAFTVRWLMFAAVGINLILTAVAPGAMGAVYANLAQWTGLDILALWGDKALWVAALIPVGLYILYCMGQDADEVQLPVLLLRTLLFAATVFVWIPFLTTLGFMQPRADFPMPLLIFFCVVFYPIFLLIRVLLSEDYEDLGSTLLGCLVAAGAIVPYFLLIKLLAGALIWVYGFAVLAYEFIAGRSWATIAFLVVLAITGWGPMRYAYREFGSNEWH